MKPVVLLILDGWGIDKPSNGNAISIADVPCFNNLFSRFPHSLLSACGTSVGLPDRVMGNSEVGHENIGGGRIVTQKLTLISNAIKDGSFFQNRTLLHAIEHTKKNNSKLHLIGLISEGDVHSHLGHLYALIDLAKKQNVKNLILHPITDGRDDPPKHALELIPTINEKIKDVNGKIATVCGRFYAMDRDNRWTRVKKYYDLITEGTGYKSSSLESAIHEAYGRVDKEIENDSPKENSDEFIRPTLIGSANDLIQDNDAIIFFNFRPDRAREISTALTQKNFSHFERNVFRKNIYYGCLTEYDVSLHREGVANPVLDVAFTKRELPEVNKENSLGEIISKHGLNQVRIAETEKFRHVTSFFNMGRQDEYPGEERILVPSPKVTTYDMKPEMSAFEVCQKTLDSINSKKYALIVVNFANADMVGHTGIIPAAKLAVEAVDKCILNIQNACKDMGSVLIITADHGNADQMINPDGSIRTAHSLNLVPFIIVDENVKSLKPSGKLADIAPTILEVMKINKPKEMNGENLIEK